jgi:Xaa-Pro aminopeptidase
MEHRMDRFRERRERLRPTLRSGDAEGVAVVSPTNVRYLTGFTGESSILLVGRERDVILSDGRFTTQLAQECPDLEARIRPTGVEMAAELGRVVVGLGWRHLAFEASACSVAEYQGLRDAMPIVELLPVKGWVDSLRRVKDAGEIEEIRAAIRCAEKAFTMVRAGLRAEDSEKDVADAIDASMRRCGASAASFPTIVAVGVRAALPHARPTGSARIGDGELVLLDWGASGEPYKSDLTRVLLTGKVTPKFETIYRTVLAAQQRAISAIRPGAKAHDIDAEARSAIEEAGFGGFFDHGLGHGIGMEIHEAPRVRKGSPDILEVGNVITVEPGIYLPDWGGVRIEDDVLVTADGSEVLSRIPKSIDSILID